MGNESLLRDTPVWTAIRRLVIPSVLTILIMVIYNIADMFFTLTMRSYRRSGRFP